MRDIVDLQRINYQKLKITISGTFKYAEIFLINSINEYSSFKLSKNNLIKQ